MLASLRLTRVAVSRPTCRLATRSLSEWACARGPLQMQARGFAKAPGGRFQNTKRARTQVLEREAEPPATEQQQNSIFSQQSQQQYQQQQQFGSAPTSAMPGYVGSRDREREEQQGSQFDHLHSGVVNHMQKVYGTLAVGIGIAAAHPCSQWHVPRLHAPHDPRPGLHGPIDGRHVHEQPHALPALRAGMFAAFHSALGHVACALALHGAQGGTGRRAAGPTHHDRPLRHNDRPLALRQARVDASAGRAAWCGRAHVDGMWASGQCSCL